MTKEINIILEKLNKHFHSVNPEMSKKERLFSRVIKLNEEVGELCEAILSEHDKNQRIKERTTNVDAELADILICVLLLAHDREKNILNEVEAKLNKLSEKFNL